MTPRTPVRLALLVGLFALAMPAGHARAADTYQIDPEHSSITFRAQHFNFGRVHGSFLRFAGKFVIDEKKPASSSVSIEVPADSIFTNVAKRDQHLRSPDFLNVKQFPKITFTSTQVRKRGNSYRVAGKLTLHGVTRDVTVNLQRLGTGKGPDGKQRSGFAGKLAIKRSDFGMKKMMGPVGDPIDLMIAVEGTKQ